jgi:hypothetical protein
VICLAAEKRRAQESEDTAGDSIRAVGERAFEKSLRVECAVEQLAGGLKKKIPVSVQRCLPSGAKAKSRGSFYLRADFSRLQAAGNTGNTKYIITLWLNVHTN